ncbi:MAG: rod shape-determining protein MreD [Candidatus Krumholzibacteria bacterium]|nr:rod shape-determining protein MreD [Candidatus Krumholzibacteria bacterium]
MRNFYLLLALLVFLVLQAVLAPRIALGSIAPDFLLLVVVFFALYRGSVRGALLGFAVGLLQDLGNPDHLGLNALTKSLLGYFVGDAGTKTFPESVTILFGLFAVSALGHDVIYLTIFHWPRVGSAFVTVVTAAIPSAVYTALFGVLVDRVFALAGAKVVGVFGKEG